MPAVVNSFRSRRPVVAALTLLWLGVASSQQVADPGFKSVGRGAPLSMALPPLPAQPPGAPGQPPSQRFMPDLTKVPFVGPMQLGGPPRGGGTAPANAPPAVMV